MAVQSHSKQKTTDDTVNKDPLTRGEIYRLISARRRRHVIHYLKQNNSQGELSELATQIAAWEHDTHPDKITSGQRKAAYTALRQAHLPKLDDAGIVSYDTTTGDVRLTETAEELTAYLEIVPENEIPWSTFYFGVSSLFIGIYFARLAGLIPFTWISINGWFLSCLGIFMVASLVQTYQYKQMELGQDGPPPEDLSGLE